MISQLFLLFWVIAGTHLGLGLGFADDNPPTGLLTKTQPGPWAGFSRAGLGGGRVLARPIRSSISVGMFLRRALLEYELFDPFTLCCLQFV